MQHQFKHGQADDPEKESLASWSASSSRLPRLLRQQQTHARINRKRSPKTHKQPTITCQSLKWSRHCCGSRHHCWNPSAVPLKWLNSLLAASASSAYSSEVHTSVPPREQPVPQLRSSSSAPSQSLKPRFVHVVTASWYVFMGVFPSEMHLPPTLRTLPEPFGVQHTTWPAASIAGAKRGGPYLGCVPIDEQAISMRWYLSSSP